MFQGCLFRELFRVFPSSLMRYSSKRSNTLSEKIQVQLLKDHPKLGVRGEIVRVKPAFMRNYLHIGNGACYITDNQGPRIPVVEKASQEQKPAIKVDQNSQETSESPAETSKGPAMSLAELSNLFSSIQNGKSSLSKGSKNSDQKFELNSENIEYTASEIDSALPPVLSLPTNNSFALPINKERLVSYIYDIAGVRLEPEMIKLSKGNTSDFVGEITHVGTYQFNIQVPGEKKSISKSLLVN